MLIENLSWNEPEKVPQELEDKLKELISESNTDEENAGAHAALSFIVLERLSSMMKDELEDNKRALAIFKAFEDITKRTLSTLLNTLPEGD